MYVFGSKRGGLRSRRGGKWMSGLRLALDFTYPVGTLGVLDVCLGCGGVGGGGDVCCSVLLGTLVGVFVFVLCGPSC